MDGMLARFREDRFPDARALSRALRNLMMGVDGVAAASQPAAPQDTEVDREATTVVRLPGSGPGPVRSGEGSPKVDRRRGQVASEQAGAILGASPLEVFRRVRRWFD
jgi:hypothetical protein